ncbi:MAG: sigma-70 family RNA polymerase sigma factor [Chitinophagales bacterium]
MKNKELLSNPNPSKIFQNEILIHADALYNFAFSLTFDAFSSQDFVQETFLKAFRFIHSYKPGTNAKAWLFQILKNAFINEYRKKKSKPTKVDFESYSEKQQLEKQALRIDITEDAYDKMLGDEVTTALNNLAIEFREAIVLADLEGFSYEEIADIMQIPIGTVRSRLYRARNLLKEQLRDFAKQKGIKEKR